MRVKRKLTADDLVTEAQLQQTCSQWLALDGWVCLVTDPVSDRGRGQGFGELGMADCQYRRQHGRVRSMVSLMWIEWKKRNGKVTAHQAAWREAERARGFLALAAGIDFDKTITGFQQWYRASGLMRKNI